ncbi:MAG: carboxypeptidase-like regulatory domain-containing protein, partial [Planctomycetota bacterium]
MLDLSRPDEPRPIADAVVARPIGRSGEKRWMPLGKTDADGRLEVDLQPGSYGFEVDPRSVDEGLARSGQFSVTGKPMRGVSKVEARLREGDQVDLELALLAGRTISGVVTGPDGAPAEGVTVMASAGAPGMEGLRLIEKTDGAGRFSFEHVYPLRYALHLWSPEPDGSTPPPVFVDVRERSQSGVRMSHGAGSLTVVGAVRDEEGNPIGGLEVLAYYSGPSTDPAAHERYRFDWGDASGLTKTRS